MQHIVSKDFKILYMRSGVGKYALNKKRAKGKDLNVFNMIYFVLSSYSFMWLLLKYEFTEHIV